MKAADKGKKGGDPSPLYYKIQLKLEKRIKSGEWMPGDTLPPERKMAERLGVSLGTIRKAILNLVAEGLLFRVQGKGTIVAGTAMIRENLRYYRFQKDFNGWEAVLKIKHLESSVIAAQKRINQLLKLDKDEELLLIRRRFSSREKPKIYTLSYFPYRLFKDLAEVPGSRLEKVPLYIIIEDMYGFPTTSNQELLGVGLANQEVAEILSIQPDSPLMELEMLAYTHHKKPYEYRIAYCLTDRTRINRQY